MSIDLSTSQGASPLGSEGSPSLRGRGTALYSFDIWDSKGECPHCGSDDIEYDLILDRCVCCWCGAVSADILTDNLELETILMNNLDRFDYEVDYERENSERYFQI